MSRVYHPVTRDAYQPRRVRESTIPAVIESFRMAGWSYREIGLLVSGYAGYFVRPTTISALAHERTSGANLAPHFSALASAWGIL
jgi:hypothetical protein